jgi:hypothetical protein
MSTTVQTSAIELQQHSHLQADSSSLRPIRRDRSRSPVSEQAQSRINDLTVPDGGYGWVVIFASSVICFWFVGTSYSWGVIQKALVDGGLSTASTLSFVGGLTPMCIALLAIFNARVIRAIGARWTAVVGVLLLGLGEILSGFCMHSVGGLFATIGVISGIGTRYVGYLKVQFV